MQSDFAANLNPKMKRHIIKPALLFLVCFAALAQSPPAAPQNLRLATDVTASTIGLTTIAGANNPLGIPHQGWAAYWQLPDTNNIWIPEYTIDGGTTWTRCGNQWASLGGDFGNWNWTETGTNWTFPYPITIDQWLVRIRNVGPLPWLRPFSVAMAAQLSPRIAQTVRIPPLPREVTPGLVLTAASIMDPDCDCRLFRVSFYAHTNHIYSFQRSRDLVNWELRPPEIDGEEGVNAFYDVFDGEAVYRVMSREGVLP